MPRAESVRQAAFHQFASFDRNIWEIATDMLPSFDEVYVERPAPEGAGRRRLASVSQRMRDDLIETQGAPKVLLTGQRGAGKSMELRRLYESVEIRTRFECLKVVLLDRLNLASAIDIRYVLLALASALAEVVVTMGYDDLRARGLGEGEFAPIVAWLDTLQQLARTPAPAVEAPPTVKISLLLGEITKQLKQDEPTRVAVLQDTAFAPSRLEKLVSGLVRLLQKAMKKDLLLLVDDGDKINQEGSARGVFIDNLPTLLSLECRAVISFPYWLNFDDAFQNTIKLCPVYTISNVKVIHRPLADGSSADQGPLPEAQTFFREVYDRLVVPDVKLIDDDAFEKAILHCAGIAREFLRILQRAFRFAHEYKDDFLTEATLAEALLELEREMIRATQLESTRRRLMKVRLKKQLDDKEDWQLLDSLLVVELTNNRPWYDVHPILQAYIDGLVAQARTRLGREGLAEPSLTDRLLQDLRGA